MGQIRRKVYVVKLLILIFISISNPLYHIAIACFYRLRMDDSYDMYGVSALADLPVNVNLSLEHIERKHKNIRKQPSGPHSSIEAAPRSRCLSREDAISKRLLPRTTQETDREFKRFTQEMIQSTSRITHKVLRSEDQLPRGCDFRNDRCIKCSVRTPSDWNVLKACVNAISLIDKVIMINTNFMHFILNVPPDFFTIFPLKQCTEEEMHRRWKSNRRLIVFKKIDSRKTLWTTDYCEIGVRKLIYRITAPVTSSFNLKFDSVKLRFEGIERNNLRLFSATTLVSLKSRCERAYVFPSHTRTDLPDYSQRIIATESTNHSVSTQIPQPLGQAHSATTGSQNLLLSDYRNESMQHPNDVEIKENDANGNYQLHLRSQQQSSGSTSGSPESKKHPQYEDFNIRITSYTHWPAVYNIHPTTLSDAGLFYSGRNDCVICFHCGIELTRWSAEDDPLEKHAKSSPDCPFLEKKLCAAQRQLFRDSLPSRIHLCTEASTPVQSDFVNFEGVSIKPTTTRQDKFPADFARSPQYAAFIDRLATFRNWPKDLPQRPPQLVEAGFFFTGCRDVVRCYVCDGGLQKWDPNDDPWTEHARWFSTCPYVLHVKGQDFVDFVQRSAQDAEDDFQVEGVFAAAQRGRSQLQNGITTGPSTTHEVGAQSTDKQQERLNTAAAQSVLSMDYSRKAVLRALDILLSKGEKNPKAEMILEVLFEMEAAGELPTDSSTLATPTPKLAFEDFYKSDYEPPSDAKALLDENEQLVEKIKCSDCQERNKNVLFLPCTHHELCEICAADVLVCPKCWREVKQKVKTFMC